MQVILSRDALIVSAANIKIEDVPVPEWGGCVRVRGFTVAERHKAQAFSRKQEEFDPELLSVEIVRLSLLNEAGERVFPDSDATAAEADRDIIRSLDFAGFNRVWKAARTLAGLDSPVDANGADVVAGN